MIAQKGKGRLTRIVILGLQLARVEAFELIGWSGSHAFVLLNRGSILLLGSLIDNSLMWCCEYEQGRSRSIRSDGYELEYTVRSRSSASKAQRWSVAS
jgi:hypothetical protein